MKSSIGKAVGKVKKESFITRLEKHKAEGRSFDNGTWKPAYKGQSFIDALNSHKGRREFD